MHICLVLTGKSKDFKVVTLKYRDFVSLTLKSDWYFSMQLIDASEKSEKYSLYTSSEDECWSHTESNIHYHDTLPSAFMYHILETG